MSCRPLAILATLVIALAIGVLVTRGRDHRSDGPVGRLAHWMTTEGQCASVDRRAYAPGRAERVRGVTSNEQLYCNMLSGAIDVETYRDHRALSVDARRWGDGAARCVVGPRQAAVDGLLGHDHRQLFARWCARLAPT